MKHLPNICTLGNLFCGCLAITYILSAPSHLQTFNGEDMYLVLGINRIVIGSLFILLAALFDMMDGMLARLMKVHSNIGKDLDSLADVVSFGVAPSMIMYQLLWNAYMAAPKALETPMYVLAPAFLIACFGALRLARFNQSNLKQSKYFTGMPIPAVGIAIALIPIVELCDSKNLLTPYLNNRLVLYIITALLCWLMVSEIKFLKWKAPSPGIKGWWPHIVTVAGMILSFFFIGYPALLLGFILYIITSLLYKYPQNDCMEASAQEKIALKG